MFACCASLCFVAPCCAFTSCGVRVEAPAARRSSSSTTRKVLDSNASQLSSRLATPDVPLRSRPEASTRLVTRGRSLCSLFPIVGVYTCLSPVPVLSGAPPILSRAAASRLTPVSPAFSARRATRPDRRGNGQDQHRWTLALLVVLVLTSSITPYTDSDRTTDLYMYEYCVLYACCLCSPPDMREAEKNIEGLEKCCGLCVLPWKKCAYTLHISFLLVNYFTCSSLSILIVCVYNRNQ